MSSLDKCRGGELTAALIEPDFSPIPTPWLQRDVIAPPHGPLHHASAKHRTGSASSALSLSEEIHMSAQQRLVLLSSVVIGLNFLASSRASARESNTRCAGGNCGACCYSIHDCETWCNQHCSGNCEAVSNPMCCEEGFSVYCT